METRCRPREVQYRRSPITVLADLCRLVESRPGLFVRYSRGPCDDADHRSRDYESGLELPGLSASPLDPEPWWTRPLEEWLARRLCSYAHLRQDCQDERVGWILAGREVGRGPDNEPLVELSEAVAVIDNAVIQQAKHMYRCRFEVGLDSTGVRLTPRALLK